MRIAVLRELAPGETRVAATPETVKKFIGLGAEVAVETGAGERASIADADYARRRCERRIACRRVEGRGDHPRHPRAPTRKVCRVSPMARGSPPG